jgi:hypothetical protein
LAIHSIGLFDSDAASPNDLGLGPPVAAYGRLEYLPTDADEAGGFDFDLASCALL